MKTVALVIAEREFRDEEYQVPLEILQANNVRVLTVSTTTNEVVGKLGMKVTPDTLMDDLDPAALDGLVFIGGGGSEQYFDDPTAHELARKTAQLGKVVGAICIAPVILANAQLLVGKTATVYPDGKDILEKQGAKYTGNPVEVDGNIITGNGPEAAKEFGKTLLKML